MTLSKDNMLAIIGKIISSNQPIDESHGTYLSKLDLDARIMILAILWAEFSSKDPNTKVGAAVYDTSTGALHLGYNGFPAGYPDQVAMWDNRNKEDDNCKYNYVVHAEVNAIRKAQLAHYNEQKSILYVSHYPCRNCAKDVIIPSNIKKVVYLHDSHFDQVSSILMKSSNVIVDKLYLSLNED